MLNDFGGDEAYSMMHHLFLDRKALAMIVYDANTFREEDYDRVIGRWLTMLTSYSPGVVVKLVGTKCDLLEEGEEGEEVPKHPDIVTQLVKKHMQVSAHYALKRFYFMIISIISFHFLPILHLFYKTFTFCLFFICFTKPLSLNYKHLKIKKKKKTCPADRL